MRPPSGIHDRLKGGLNSELVLTVKHTTTMEWGLLGQSISSLNSGCVFIAELCIVSLNFESVLSIVYKLLMKTAVLCVSSMPGFYDPWHLLQTLSMRSNVFSAFNSYSVSY